MPADPEAGHMVIRWSTAGVLLFIFWVQRPNVISVFVRGALVPGVWNDLNNGPDRIRCQFGGLNVGAADVQ
jgi:hypothetical protein